MIAGFFTTYNGQNAQKIARLNADGTLDTTFNPGTGANSTVYDIALLSNGQMYVGGFFTTFNGLANTNDIVRLNANGTVDTGFNSGSGFNGGVYTLSLEPDGKLLAGGNFLDYNATPVNRLALLNSNGTRDASFNSPLDGNILNFVYRLHRQPDNKILVGGGFTVPRNALLRLNATTTIPRVPFDFDGDGKTDIAIFRPSAGEWWINRSSNSSTFATQFGTGTDKIAPADYTGDGKTDIAVFRPSTGEWYVLRSEDLSFYAFPFGTSGDVPVRGDYDGDGRTDAAVFRPSNSTWYVQRTTAGTLIQTFGTTGDIAVPSAYLP